MRLAACFVLLAQLVTAGSAAAQASVPQSFKQWSATCRDDGYCVATTHAGTAYESALRFGRHAEEIYWELSLSTDRAAGLDAAPGVSVAVDGVAELFAGPSEIAAYGSAGDYFLLGAKAQAVMDRLAPGTALSVAYADADGTPVEVTLALDGLMASLIWIDEQQRRLGSERVAEAPPFGLEPVSPAAAPGAPIAHMAADSECGFQELTAADVWHVYPEVSP